MGAITGLGKVKKRIGNKSVKIDLNEAAQISVRPLAAPPAVQAIEAKVEAKQGAKVLATLARRAELGGAPAPRRVAVRVGRDIVIVPARPPATPGVVASPRPGDDDLVRLGGALNVIGAARGAGKSIRPPAVEIAEARLAPSAPAGGPDDQGRRFVGHRGGLWSVAISPDGRRLLSASHDFSVRLWDVESGRELMLLSGHTDHVKGVAFLPDGKRGISGADDDTLRLWDLETGRELRRFIGHTADLSSVAVSPDGRRALSSAIDRTIRLWDIESGRQIRALTGHTAAVIEIAFLPDGQRALSAGDDGTVRLWDLQKGRPIGQLATEADQHFACVAVSPDGRLGAAGASDGVVRIWEIESGRLRSRLERHGDAVLAVAFTPDGRSIVSSGGGKDPTIRLWDAASGREQKLLGTLRAVAQAVAIAPDGRNVALALGDGTAELCNLPDAAALGTPVKERPLPLVRKIEAAIDDLTVGGGGRYILMVLRDARKLAVFDVNAANVVKRITLPASNALVAAGAQTFVIAYPDQKLIERFSFDTMTREGATRPSPIRADQGSGHG